ncbi:MAG: hypothetical protein RSC98_06065, partial [Clostridia bacterium]
MHRIPIFITNSSMQRQNECIVDAPPLALLSFVYHFVDVISLFANGFLSILNGLFRTIADAR